MIAYKKLRNFIIMLKRTVKRYIILFIIGLYINNQIVIASNNDDRFQQQSYQMKYKKDEIVKDYIRRYVPENAKPVSADSTIEFMYNVDIMTPGGIIGIPKNSGSGQSVKDSGFVGRVYTFASLEDGEEKYDVIVDCYFLKMWKPYSNDRLSIIFDGYLGYVSPMEGELWGRDFSNQRWEFEKEIPVDFNVVYGTVFADCSSFSRILLHFPCDRINQEQDQNYYILYEAAKREVPNYFFIIVAGIVSMIVFIYWRRKCADKK